MTYTYIPINVDTSDVHSNNNVSYLHGNLKRTPTHTRARARTLANKLDIHIYITILSETQNENTRCRRTNYFKELGHCNNE